MKTVKERSKPVSESLFSKVRKILDIWKMQYFL
jgi:hypothetical protein